MSKQRQTSTTLPETGKSRRRRRGAVLFPLLAAIACLSAGFDFSESRHGKPPQPSPELTGTGGLSDYLPALRHTRGDSEIYFFEGEESGGTVLILGGTHPNEPAGFISASLLVENLKVARGRVIVLPQANASAFTATEPQEAYPASFLLTSRREKQREFRVGSRFTNILDGWPDPIVYRHYPSGQLLSGNETRNLNRAYPGRPDGSFTERLAFAITELVRREKVDLVIDLHEAAPEYPVVNAIVAHERAMDLAAMAAVELQLEGLDFRLEPSPPNFHGLSHRELGDHTGAMAVLIEATGALQGRIRGATDAGLIIHSRDPMYARAAALGKLQVPFPETGIPLEERVGRHLSSVQTLVRLMGEFQPEKTVSFSRIPTFTELQKRGVGYYFK